MYKNNNKEETKMDRVPTELEFMQAIINHARKEEELETMININEEREALVNKMDRAGRDGDMETFMKVSREITELEANNPGLESGCADESEEVSLNTNPEEELTMTNTDKVSTELELMEQLMSNLNNKEETDMTDNKKELLAAKGLVVGVNQLTISNLLGDVESKHLSTIVQEVAAALVAIEKRQVDKLKVRVTKKLGNETYKSIIRRGGNREMFNKIWKTITTIANQYYIKNKEEENMININEEKMEIMQQEAKEIQKEELEREFNHIQEETDDWVEEVFADPVFGNNKKEEEAIKMDLQFFASKEEEESIMLEQIEKFKDIAKQIEEIDAVGGDVYVGGVKVSWDSVKQFVYGLSDDELEFLAYSNKPEIPGEMEVFAIYLLEAEKAWDNELSIQNNYFNSRKESLVGL